MGLGKMFLGMVLCVCLSAEATNLKQVASAAQKRGLPMRFFREIAAWGGWETVSIRSSDAPRYYPWSNLIEIPSRQFSMAPSKWSAIDWADFYNELLHAWWDVVFERQEMYRATRERLAKLESHYADACPANPDIAQEEAFSETTAALIIYLANGVSPAKLPYDTSRTVGAVSHGDRPGFTEQAENTYLLEEEYGMLFLWLTGTSPPNV